MVLKKCMSYLIPQRLKSVDSPYNGRLEVLMVNGNMLLDSEQSNYSFGSLHKILRIGLSEVGFDHRIRNVLVLGMGAGSIVHLLRDEWKSDAAIDLVDIDPVIINIAEEIFEIEKFAPIRTIQSSAEDFVQKAVSKYDFILMDIFVQMSIPTSCLSETFLYGLAGLLNPKGVLLINTIRDTMGERALIKLCEDLESHQLTCKIVKNVLGTNDLVIAKKG